MLLSSDSHSSHRRADRLNTFLELKIENERLRQRRDAAMARLNGQQARQAQVNVHQSQSHFRSPSYSFAYPPESPAAGFETRLVYPYDDRSPGGSATGTAGASQEDRDDHAGPRKKVCRCYASSS